MAATPGFDFAHPAWLWLLPLAVLPWLAPTGPALAAGALRVLPPDRASAALAAALRAAASLALAALVVGLAGPYRPEYPVERQGRGAEIVLVLDRSRSMDQGFAGAGAGAASAPTGTGPEAIAYYMRLQQNRGGDSKGKTARQLLSEFVARRPDDRFGLVVFSTLPMRVLDFTHKQEVIQAAIAAGNVGRGLAETDIGSALEAALTYFDDRPYAGSRLIMLVSDGGDQLDAAAQQRIADRMRRHRVGLDWFYLRSANSPGLHEDTGSGADNVSEYALHRYFQSLGVPYKAYEADNPEALQKAIDDVGRLQNLPIAYFDTVPRRDLAPLALGTALACVLVLLAASAAEIRRWSA